VPPRRGASGIGVAQRAWFARIAAARASATEMEDDQ
jgi:hypothetical protein